MTRIIDLSHPLSPATPVYPGTEPPRLTPASTREADGFNELRLEMVSHTGTHMDAPAHILPDGASLDQLPIDRFIGPGCLIDVRGSTRITADDLAPHAAALGLAAFAILRTGWEVHWGAPRYFEGFPLLEPDAARLLTESGLSGVGVDAISVDGVETAEFPIHHILLGAGLVIIENLANLEALPPQDFEFTALPLPIANGDGSPVRAVARIKS